MAGKRENGGTMPANGQTGSRMQEMVAALAPSFIGTIVRKNYPIYFKEQPIDAYIH